MCPRNLNPRIGSAYQGSQRTIIGVIGDKGCWMISADLGRRRSCAGNGIIQAGQQVIQARASVIDVNAVKIGGKEIVIMAGPCAVESRSRF